MRSSRGTTKVRRRKRMRCSTVEQMSTARTVAEQVGISWRSCACGKEPTLDEGKGVRGKEHQRESFTSLCILNVFSSLLIWGSQNILEHSFTKLQNCVVTWGNMVTSILRGVSDIAIRMRWLETDHGAPNASLLVLSSRLSHLWNVSKLLTVWCLFTISTSPIAECIFPAFGHFMLFCSNPGSSEMLPCILLRLHYTSSSQPNPAFRKDKSASCIVMRVNVTGRREGKENGSYLLQDFWSHETSLLQAFVCTNSARNIS